MLKVKAIVSWNATIARAKVILLETVLREEGLVRQAEAEKQNDPWTEK
jgi:hypothetical protein